MRHRDLSYEYFVSDLDCRRPVGAGSCWRVEPELPGLVWGLALAGVPVDRYGVSKVASLLIEANAHL